MTYHFPGLKFAAVFGKISNPKPIVRIIFSNPEFPDKHREALSKLA